MTLQLPTGLSHWFIRKGWEILTITPILGGFAATSIYRIRVRTESSDVIDVVYKQFTKDRAQELDLYDKAVSNLPNYAPKMLGRVIEGEEQGIVVVDAGQPLKSRFQAQSPEAQEQLLRSTVLWMADMHIQLEALSRAWLEAGRLGLYPIESSMAWGQDALDGLQWLMEAENAQVNQAVYEEVKAMVASFYPRLQSWMLGRMTITHGDPHMENIMYNHDQFMLVDWEFTCVAVPQRDLSILLQDVLDDDLHQLARDVYWNRLREHGWDVDAPSFEQTYQACLFDNTCMMLGWEVYKFRQGHMDESALEAIVTAKLRWMKDSFKRLQPCSE